jgi:hypothetical protein
MGLLEDALQTWPEEIHPRFQATLTALTVIAAIARSVNQEPELSLADVRGFLGHLAAFLNSFSHP